jgi:O-antigen/teichoic acid export membrane protein
MNSNLNSSQYFEYFKKGISYNIFQVGVSLPISFVTATIFFANLTKQEYILFGLVQITVFFFVNFSTLELHHLIRKEVPKSNLEKGLILTIKLFKSSLIFFVITFIFFFIITRATSFYVDFSSYYLEFYIFIFLNSLVQLVVRFLSEYLNAVKVFDRLEKSYIKILTPYKILSLAFFYFLSTDLITALLVNFFLRCVQLIVVYSHVKKKRIIIPNLFSKIKMYSQFDLKRNIIFTSENFLYMNFPLMFISLIPILLNKTYGVNDVAIFTLVISIFNAVKPILHAVPTILNPKLVELTNRKLSLKELFKTTSNLLILVHCGGMLLIWITLNFNQFSESVLPNFSYLLFSDYIISIICMSLFYVLTKILQSICIAVDKSRLFFNASLGSVFPSVIFFYLFINYQFKINFIFAVLIIFYVSKYLILIYKLRKNEKFTFSILQIIPFSCIFALSLTTISYDSLALFIILFTTVLTVTLLYSYKFLKELGKTL